jgi:hypothetical protein
MKLSNDKLPAWISRQASLGPNVQVEGMLTNDNAFWYLLTVCCPLIFESYAIILHPFWINWKAKDLTTSGLKISEDQTDNSDFKRVSWRHFFSIYGKSFNLETAYKTQEELSEELRKDYPSYVWFPGEGDCESEELTFVLQQVSQLYGDIIANYYYCLLKTEKWETEHIYRGRLSEFAELKFQADIRDNPTAIFSDDKKWCIVSDYDLPFTYIGGSTELIDSIVSNSDFEIFKLTPIFNEKLENTCT